MNKSSGKAGITKQDADVHSEAGQCFWYSVNLHIITSDLHVLRVFLLPQKRKESSEVISFWFSIFKKQFWTGVC